MCILIGNHTAVWERDLCQEVSFIGIAYPALYGILYPVQLSVPEDKIQELSPRQGHPAQDTALIFHASDISIGICHRAQFSVHIILVVFPCLIFPYRIPFIIRRKPVGLITIFLADPSAICQTEIFQSHVRLLQRHPVIRPLQPRLDVQEPSASQKHPLIGIYGLVSAL